MDPIADRRPTCSQTGHQQLAVTVWYCQHYQRWTLHASWLSDTASPDDWDHLEHWVDFGPFDDWDAVQVEATRLLTRWALPAVPGSVPADDPSSA